MLRVFITCFTIRRNDISSIGLSSVVLATLVWLLLQDFAPEGLKAVVLVNIPG